MKRTHTWLIALASFLAAAQAQTFIVLHTFAGYPSDAANPASGYLAIDPEGNLYGASVHGGSNNCVSEGRTTGCGTIFELQGTTATILYNFGKNAGGYYPEANVIRDTAGNLYGTTLYQGTNVSGGKGLVYELPANGSETALHTFHGSPDGQQPYAQLVQAPDGALFGTTRQGGTNYDGTIFKISAEGKEEVIYSFNGTDGLGPYAGVIRDERGNLYGTTYLGGSDGNGVAFELEPDGTYTILHNFTGGSDGGNPSAPLMRDKAGNLYGVTAFGGIADNGVVFKIDASGDFSVLYSFTGPPDGGAPIAGLVQDAAGNLYGTTNLGGETDQGTVFKLDTSNTETVLHSFTGDADGSYPASGLIPGPSGYLYGTSSGSGPTQAGAIFAIQP